MKKFLILALLATSPLVFGEEKTSTRSYPVGELGAAWQFPSDHLPVGGTIGNVNFALWNTLNTLYLGWIEKNAQGLKDSLIMIANTPGQDQLTKRETIVVDSILAMVKHPHYPRSVIALQELSEKVYRDLEKRLPSSVKLLPQNLDNRVEDIFLVDTEIFDILDYSIRKYSFKENTIATVTLREKASNLKYKFIQSHVPGGPVDSQPAREEFAQVVMDNYDSDAIMVLLGDMNRSPDFFLPHFEKAAKERGLSAQPFITMEIPYPTHVNTHMEASWIDNIFFATPYPAIIHRSAQDAMELFDGLQPAIDVLTAKDPG